MKTIGFRRRLDGLVEFGNDQKFSLALACKRSLSARDRDGETETIKIKSQGRDVETETSSLVISFFHLEGTQRE